MKTWRQQAIALAGIVAIGLLTWAMVAKGASLVDSLTAIFTAVAGVAAAFAAYASRDAARDSRRALALHYRPMLQLLAHPSVFENEAAKPGDPQPIRVELLGQSLIEEITVGWHHVDGSQGKTVLRPDTPTHVPGLALLKPVPAWTVSWAQATVTCRDVRAPWQTWVAHLDRGEFPGLLLTGQLSFQPQD